MKKLIMICIPAAVMMAPLAAYARPGRVFVGPGFGWGYSPYWGAYPYPNGYYGYAAATGAVKFDTKVKTMNLRPGSYDIEVRAPGRTQFDKKVYVAAGKTLHLNPDLRVQARPQAQ